VNRDEAERVADEINHTPGWGVLEVFELGVLNANNHEYGVRAWHQPSGTVEDIPGRSAWDILKAKFAKP
jgi:hypothetical protein